MAAAPHPDERRASRDPWLIGVLAIGAVLAAVHLNWGLPNGNNSWAADALGPLTVLSIARHSVTSWNCGWFYYKYPLGYPLILLAAYAPYLALLWITGQFRHPKAVYPYGFANPDAALYSMELIGRSVSVVFILATAVLTYSIGKRLFGRTAGVLAAWFAVTAYPLLYYAHTTNLDASYLFWLILALWATIVAAQSDARWSYVILGVAAAMAVSTKEQAFAFLLPLPLIIAASRQRAVEPATSAWRRWWLALWNRNMRVGLFASLATMVLANNIVINPSGFLNRIAYLSGRQVPGVSARLAPVEFAIFKGPAKEWEYIRQLFDGIESSIGLPLLLLVVAGVAYVVWSQRRAAFYLLTPAVVHYFLSLRTLDLITLRYTLPLTVIGAVCAGALCARLLASRQWRVAAVLVAGIGLWGLARGVELDLLLWNDTRYQAEAWMRAHMPASSTVETYQKPVYLPRFHDVTVHAVPLEERRIDAVEQRRPQFIVMSSAAKKGITHRWNPDWRQGHTLLIEEPAASALVDALQHDRLPYRVAARFSRQPELIRSRITSLCPEITVYQRVP
jgi:4-amino-4-deoxy-L-arabinose transferase-like glycosyltransferase